MGVEEPRLVGPADGDLLHVGQLQLLRVVQPHRQVVADAVLPVVVGHAAYSMRRSTAERSVVRTRCNASSNNAVPSAGRWAYSASIMRHTVPGPWSWCSIPASTTVRTSRGTRSAGNSASRSANS